VNGNRRTASTAHAADGAAIAKVRATLEGDGDLVALDVLGSVLQWATDVLRGDAVDTPATAFRAVALADRAFAVAPALFSALTALVERGEPAAEVAADLEHHRERLAELQWRMEPQRERLAALLEAEERLRAEIARQDEITARIAELERIERLGADVAELRAQRDKLEERAQVVAATVISADAELSAAGERLITLTGELLDSLARDTRALLLRAREQDRLLEARLAERRTATERIAAETERKRAELAQAEAAAAEAQARYERAHTEAAGRLAALQRYAAADHAVGAALAGRPREGDETRENGSGNRALLPDVMHALDEIQARLAEVDAVLGQALTADKQNRERAGIPVPPGED